MRLSVESIMDRFPEPTAAHTRSKYVVVHTRPRSVRPLFVGRKKNIYRFSCVRVCTFPMSFQNRSLRVYPKEKNFIYASSHRSYHTNILTRHWCRRHCQLSIPLSLRFSPRSSHRTIEYQLQESWSTWIRSSVVAYSGSILTCIGTFSCSGLDPVEKNTK
jgi:hypothetical protein